MASPLAPIYVANNPNANIAEWVTGFDVNLTLDQESQFSITVLDRGLRMLRSNYFQARQSLNYLGMKYEISVIEVSQGSGGPEVRLDCRPEAIQALKRWKTGEVVNAGSASGYVAQKARDVGLATFVQTAPQRSNVSQASSTNSDESVWDVMRRLANDVGFVLFETDNRLYFASEPFLLGKFALAGYGASNGFLQIPVRYESEPMNTSAMRRFAPAIPSPPDRPPLARGNSGIEVAYLQTVLQQRAGFFIADPSGTFGLSTETAVTQLQAFLNITGNPGKVGNLTWNIIDFLALGVDKAVPAYGTYYLTPLGVPNMRLSDNAYEAATASFTVEREYGRHLRPGMTVTIENVPGFEGAYLITEVSWREGSNDPVSVNARTLVEPKPNAQNNNEELNIYRRSLSLTGGNLADAQNLATLGNNP